MAVVSYVYTDPFLSLTVRMRGYFTNMQGWIHCPLSLVGDYRFYNFYFIFIYPHPLARGAFLSFQSVKFDVNGRMVED